MLPLGYALLYGLIAVGCGALALGGMLNKLNRLLRWSLSGAIGFGLIGTVTFFLGIFGLLQSPAVILFAAVGLLGWWRHWKSLKPVFSLPQYGWIAVLLIVVVLLLRLPFALSPSGTEDWDSISHQLAMAKIWLNEGRLTYIDFMHHSNVPATINLVYVWALDFGDQYAAKCVSWLFMFFAVGTVAGFASLRWGAKAGLWSALATAAIPAALWEAGTAYVDVAHGVFIAGAVLAAAEYLRTDDRAFLWLSGLSMGLALSSKYTAFFIAIGIVIAAVIVIRGRERWKAFGLATVLALLIASPWYVRNVVNTGNPVYPFFYSVFGGSNWSEANEEAYKAEQARFGQEDRGFFSVPGAVTALATRPDLHINGGSVVGALGAAFLVGLLVYPLTRKLEGADGLILVAVGVALVLWALQTQQSRYIIGLALLGSVYVGAIASSGRLVYLMCAGVLAQFGWCVYVFAYGFQPQIQNSMAFSRGEVSEEELTTARLPWYPAINYLNDLQWPLRVPKKVALFDEVRGFNLDVDYLWANPQHHTLIDYDEIETPGDFIQALIDLEVTHIYASVEAVTVGPEAAALRLGYEDRALLAPDVPKFRRLLAGAVREGRLNQVDIGFSDGRATGYLFDFN